MKEHKNNPEQLTLEFEQFLRRYLKAGNTKAQRQYNLKYHQEITPGVKLPPIEAAATVPADQLKQIFEYIGSDYGVFTNIDDQKLILGHILPTIKDVRTLSIGSGLAPHEIFLSSKGLLREEVVATDYAQSVLKKGRRIANDLGVKNVKFKNLDALDLPFKEEFGQVWLIDSLHWMTGWRNVLVRAVDALYDNGTMFLCYSRFSPRIQINENDAITELASQNMDLNSITLQESHAASKRVIIVATKSKLESNKLIIPVNSSLN